MTEEEYRDFEDLIHRNFVTEKYTIYSWCDISWYDYWVKQENDNNYVTITIDIKENLTELEIEELDIKIDAIIDELNNNL